MAQVKASGICLMRRHLRGLPGDREAEVVAGLGEAARQIYLNAIPAASVPLEQDGEILRAVAAVLFPGDGDGLRKLGRLIAPLQLTGLYRIMFQMISVVNLIKTQSAIWRLFYDQGRSGVSIRSARSLEFFVKELPELNREERLYTCGFLEAMLELAKTRNVRVTHQDADPGNWIWRIEWD